MRATPKQLPLPLPGAPDGESDWPFEPAFELVEGGVGVAEPTTEVALRPRNELVAEARVLAERLARRLGHPVELKITDNRSTMLSFRRKPEGLLIRAHHMFLGAAEHVAAALADYVSRPNPRVAQQAGAVIDRFISENDRTIRPQGSRPGAPTPRAEGRHHDLKPLFDRLNLMHFDNRVDARIGWGRGLGRGEARRRRSIRMGVYDHVTRSIRIHPLLDRPEVPEFFIGYIVFHEMLHQALPGRQKGSRRQHHGPEFRARERAYPDYERAIAWEKTNLSMLLAARRGPQG